jgi:hypothetical protein
MKAFFETIGVVHPSPQSGFKKNDGFKTLVRLKAQLAGMPVDDVPPNDRIRRWMEMFRTVLPPESFLPRRTDQEERGFWI